jgi:hypothetical protein
MFQLEPKVCRTERSRATYVFDLIVHAMQATLLPVSRGWSDTAEDPFSSFINTSSPSNADELRRAQVFPGAISP